MASNSATNRPVNVLSSSTRQWNPGDEFIERGCKQILRDYLPQSCNWHLWDRNPDRSVDPDTNWNFREGLQSNSAVTSNLEYYDAVLLAGSPEWLGPRLGPVFDFLDSNPTVPLICMGVGSAGGDWSLSLVESRVLSRPNTLILCRSIELQIHLKAKLPNKVTYALPCPAIFSAGDHRDFHSTGRKAVILQTPQCGNQSIPKIHFEEILGRLSTSDPSLDIIVMTESEYHYMRSLKLENAIVYSESSLDYVGIFRRYGAIASTRLHGAIAAYSAGVAAAVFDRNDYRVNTCVRMFGGRIPIAGVEECFSGLLSEPPKVSDPDIRHFKGFVQQAYADLLSSFFEVHPLF